MALTNTVTQGSAIQDQLGQGHLVAGSITVSAGTDAVLTCNDGSAVLSRTNAGDYTVTFGEPFAAVPYAVCSAVVPTYSTLTNVSCNLVSVATNAIRLNVSLTTESATVGALSDTGSVQFMVSGKRYV